MSKKKMPHIVRNFEGYYPGVTTNHNAGNLSRQFYEKELRSTEPTPRARQLMAALLRDANAGFSDFDPMDMRFNWDEWVVDVTFPPGHRLYPMEIDAAESLSNELWGDYGPGYMASAVWTFLVWTGMQPPSAAPGSLRPIMELAEHFDRVYEQYWERDDD